MTNEGPLVSRLWQQGPVRLLSAFETEAKTDTFISNCEVSKCLLFLLHTTRFRVFGRGWVQSTTFLGFFSFHDYLVVIGLYASLYIGNKETYKNLENNQYFGLLQFS